MQDRVSKYPGRVTLIPVQGLENTYTMERADEPTQPGTPLNKSTLLTDATANLMGGAVQTPDDAFMRLILLSQTGGMVTAQVTSSDGSPVENLKVTGLLDIAKKPVFTDSGGRAVGIAEAGKRTIGISGYADVVDSTQSVQIENGSIYELSFTVSSRNYLNISSARNVMFSPNVATIDYDVVGAGGGGGGQDRFHGGGGGGGGAIQTVTGVSVVPNQVYSVTIGAGGTTNDNGQTGNPGGQSSFMETVAEGGQGGKNEGNKGIGGEGGQPGGGRGGNKGRDGTPGGVRFSSFTQTEMCSGGGGGSGGSGGNGGGGDGGADNQNGTRGQKPGAGGGGGGAPDDLVDWQTYGGKGHDGCVDIRMHLKQGG